MGPETYVSVKSKIKIASRMGPETYVSMKGTQNLDRYHNLVVLKRSLMTKSMVRCQNSREGSSRPSDEVLFRFSVLSARSPNSADREVDDLERKIENRKTAGRGRRHRMAGQAHQSGQSRTRQLVFPWIDLHDVGIRH